MEFFMSMIPSTVTAQEQKTGIRNGKPYRYDPHELLEARSKLLADVLGHGDVKMTQLYLRQSQEQQQDAVDKAVDW